MSLVGDVIDRLRGSMPGLVGGVQGAVELADLVRQGTLPQRSPAAFVLPSGARGEPNAYAAGGHRQRVTETVAIVLILRSAGDATGAKSLVTIDALVSALETVIAGWTAPSAASPFNLVRTVLLDLTAGAVFLQSDFAADRYIRSTS